MNSHFFGFRLQTFTIILFFVVITVVTMIPRVNYIKDVAIEEIEPRGQYNSEVETILKATCQKMFIDFDKLTITATTTRKNYGERLYVEISYPITLSIIGNKKFYTIRSESSISSEYVIR